MILAASQTAVAALQHSDAPQGIPVWVWPVVGVLALVWIKVLLPESLFRRVGPKEKPAPRQEPVAFTPQREAAPLVEPSPPAAWTPEFINGLTLNQLETLIQRFWALRGCEVTRGRAADGAIELLISRPGAGKLFAVGQCAPTRGEKIGAVSVKALAASGAHKSAGLAVFYSLPGFTEEALALAKGQPIKLMTAEGLLADIRLLTPIQQQRLLEQTLITSGPTLARS